MSVFSMDVLCIYNSGEVDFLHRLNSYSAHVVATFDTIKGVCSRSHLLFNIKKASVEPFLANGFDHAGHDSVVLEVSLGTLRQP